LTEIEDGAANEKFELAGRGRVTLASLGRRSGFSGGKDVRIGAVVGCLFVLVVRGAGEGLNTNDMRRPPSLQYYKDRPIINQPLGSGNINIQKLPWLLSFEELLRFERNWLYKCQSSTPKNRK
jgi:hypothetical protein